MYIDTHCHISRYEYDDINLVIKNLDNNIAIISGCDEKTNEEVVQLVNKYPNIYGTIGIHPSEVNNISNSALLFIEKNINNPKIVGIGEIGLDYHFDLSNKEKQQELFINQIELAIKYNKPIVIHSRDAAQDTLDIIKKYPNLKKVLHCYSYSLEMAKEFLKLNVKFGIGGVVTFKNSRILKSVVEYIDINNILLETDSPYLAPEPFRGSKNEPKNIPLIATKIAEIKQISEDEVIKLTASNAISQFDLDI